MQSTLDKQTAVLPTLEDSIHLLEADGETTGPLQSLVLDHLLLNDGEAYWIDAAGYARTDVLAKLAPSKRLLDRIHVARGFTAYQHLGLVNRVTSLIDDSTVLIVVPALDAMYRGDDLQGPSAETMIRTAVDRLHSIHQQYAVPIVVTCQHRDDLTVPVAERAETTLRCESTQFGPRFVGEDFETLVYQIGNGYVQTTLTFWERVLSRRASTVTGQTESMGVPSHGAN